MGCFLFFCTNPIFFCIRNESDYPSGFISFSKKKKPDGQWRKANGDTPCSRKIQKIVYLTGSNSQKDLPDLIHNFLLAFSFPSILTSVACNAYVL